MLMWALLAAASSSVLEFQGDSACNIGLQTWVRISLPGRVSGGPAGSAQYRG